MADFGEILRDDLENVFFDSEEFAKEVVHRFEAGEETLKVIFDTNSEIILEGASEFGESVANVPSILLREIDTKNISYSSIFIIDGESYKMRYKHREDKDLTRIYLEKRREILEKD